MRNRTLSIALVTLVAAISVLLGGCISQFSGRASRFFPDSRQCALSQAASSGRLDEVDRLLSQGVDINYQGADGMTALAWTFLMENREGFEHLLRKGANPNIAMPLSNLTSDGLIDGNSAISLAAMHEDPWFLRVALKHGGNPNYVNPVRNTPVIFNCITYLDHSDPHPRLENISLLVDAGADLNSWDQWGYTPMMQAAGAVRFDIVHYLLNKGADPRLVTNRGTTLAELVRESRVDPESPLYGWRTKVITLLLSKGIDVNAVPLKKNRR